MFTLVEKMKNECRGIESSYGEFAHGGFVITAALASLCFSWLRATDNDEHRKYVLTNCAKQFVLSALFFLIASEAMYSADLYPPKGY